MPRRIRPGRDSAEDMEKRSHGAPDDAPRDVPTWTNVLVTDDMPIRWTTEDGDPPLGDELAGRLIIGHEDQLVIDMCGTAATKLLHVLATAHNGTGPLKTTGNAPEPDGEPSERRIRAS